RDAHYPEILILEYGVDRPGDMKHLLDIARPNIAVLTAIGEVPVHVEFFSSPEALAREKAKLIEYLPTAGFAVLNNDDGTVMDLKHRTRGHIMTFGFGKHAEVRILNFETRAEEGRPAGIAFKLQYIGTFVPVRLDGVFGKAQAYAIAAGAALGLVFGMNLVKIAERLKHYHPAEGRMQLIPGIKSAYVLDDSYNASPLSMHAALDTLRELPGKRKVAVLGNMRELGSYSMEAHEYLGGIAAKVIDSLVTVGPHGKLIAEGARKKGINRKNIQSFDSAEEVLPSIQNLVKKGDVILVKGSRAMHLEKVVEALRAPSS
ncbi:MAG: UDP-N-acetylmuramoyl-tripeptide--D-alanyl-D-alanine ligase, partial [Patescibacteria group bacterium]